MEDAHHPTQRIRVLVGSTDTHLRKLLGSSVGHDRRFEMVAQATDGEAVVACPAVFDAAVVDVSIAGLGILGVMSHLRSSPKHPVLVVVSRTDAIYLRHACLAEGAADYLVLPGDLEQLPDRIVRAVQSSVTLVRSD